MLSYAPTLLGSTTPRLYTPPIATGPPGPCGCGCALSPATSKGFSAISFARDVLEVEPLPWQRWLLIHSLELRPDGRFRYRTVLLMVGRQNGKTTIVEVKNLWKLYVLKVGLIIGTAQNLDLSEESWDKAVEIAESIPDLAAEIAHVDRTNGKKALKLTHGSRWKIAAASRKGGRGFPADDVNLDELREHQSWDSWAAVSKTTMARREAQVWAFSNAGDDKSVVLNDLQAKGRAAVEHGADLSFGMFEWSAPDDVRCTCIREPAAGHLADCMLQDRRYWAMANPSLGYTVTEEALASALATDPEPIFRTECLCQHVTSLELQWQVIPQGDWLLAADSSEGRLAREGRPVFCLEMAPDRSWAAILAAHHRPDGLRQVEVIDHRPGTGWIPGRAEALKKHEPVCWVVARDSPASSEVPTLEALGIEVVRMGHPDAVAGAGMVYDGIAGDLTDSDGQDEAVPTPRTLRHAGQDQLDAAVAAAMKRPPDQKAWAWDRARPWSYLLIGITGAVWGLATQHGTSSFNPGVAVL